MNSNTQTRENKPRYRLDDVKAAARGRWPEILQALNVPAALTNQSIPRF